MRRRADRGSTSLAEPAVGLNDAADKCPTEAGPVDRQGCPQKDSDNDGILDEQDACPNEAGTAELKGCAAKANSARPTGPKPRTRSTATSAPRIPA